MKIYVIGCSCSGKSTLALKLAARLDITHIELDQIWWLPDWQERKITEFRQIVESRLNSSDNWVIDGNYRRVRDIILPQVDQIIWLNLPFHIVFWRSITRTISRSISHKSVCNGNYERLSALLSRDGMPAWIIRSYKIRKQYGSALKATDNRVIELKTPKAINTFLKNLKSMISY
ncbi:MAG: adenylate kinase [Candidatus Cloacimonetes bacterium]|nr:adenylate kinase [Candidatus Cloacimonadota bacterium]